MKNRGAAAFAASWVTVAILLFSGRAGATVHSFTTSDSESTIRATLGALAAGDEVVFAAGTYTFNGHLQITAPGTAVSPVLIHPATGAAVVFEQMSSSYNLVEIKSSSYLTFTGIELAPNAGSPGALPLRIQSSSHVTISDCDIHGFISGISANLSGDALTDIQIIHNEIHDLTNGSLEGVFLGCASAACTVTGSVVRDNWIHDTSSLTGGSGDGIQVKKGSTAEIRDNVVTNVVGACIQVFGGSADGGAVSSTIERNACIKTNDNGISVGSDAVVRNNVVVAPGAVGIGALTTDSITPGNLTIQNNTLVVGSSHGILLNNVGGAVAVYDNAIYSQSADAIRATGTTAMVTAIGNFGIGTLTGVSSGFSATGNLTNDFGGVAYDGSALNVYPKVGSVLIGSADSAHIATDDYNASIRGTQYDVGAYLYSATGNPGATIAAGFKTLPAPPDLDGGTDAGSDGGVVVADGGSSDAGAKDGGASGSDASLGGDSGGATTTRDDAGSNASNGSSGDDSGCGCHIGPASDSSGYAFAVMTLGLAALGGARRTRNRRARARRRSRR